MVGRDTNLVATRGPSKLELAYLNAANDLCRMVCRRHVPADRSPGEMHTGPRAGDGLLRLDADGTVVYVSPNALSAYRRLGLTGDLLGAELAPLTRPLIDDPFDAAATWPTRIKAALAGAAPAADGGRGARRRRCCSGRCRCARRAGRRARWCWSAT